ncbi:MAG: tandem-95 repeat protein, partial [Algicola sp.]|nr:tandem-95 repeat protein [Algicola sp.]
PVAVADTHTINEDTVASIAVLANDTDADGDTLTVTGAIVDVGVLTIVNSTTLSYTPIANFFGSKIIHYTISDGVLSASSTVTLTIDSVEDVPIAVAETITINEDSSINVPVLNNDSDGDGDTLSVTTAGATNGTASVNSDTTIDYIPNADFNGVDTINYTITDGKGTASSTVTVNINAVPDVPVAVADSQTTNEDTPVNIVVTTNDTDADGDSITLINATMATSNGGVAVLNDSTLTYTPNANFNGVETIIYNITDGTLTGTGTVTVTVTAVNDNPVAVADTINATEDTLIAISPLTNDSDVDGDTLTITAANAGSGTATIDGNNINYTPSANFNGSDTVTYTISDGVGASPGIAASSIAVTIAAVDDPPIAVADTVSTNEDTLVNIDILTNDIEVDGDTLIVQSASASSGTVSIEPDKTLNYTPPADFNGSDTITYFIYDGTTVASTTVAVTVNAVNDNPVAATDTITVNEDTLINIDVLANDSDAESGTLSITSQSALHGTVTVSSGPSLDYTPTADYNGADVITYGISDGTGGTATGIVNITVDPVNDAPVVTGETVSLNEDTSINVNVLANDTDVEGTTLIVSGTPSAANGSVTLESDKTLSYIPTLNFNGSDTITYQVSDGTDTTNGSVAVTVDPIADNPIAVADSASTNEDTLKNIDILSNDSDPDGGTLTVSAAGADNGVVTIKADKTLDYVPNVNYNGSDTISYTIQNATGPANSTVAVTVDPVNDAPTISPVSASVNENSANNTPVVSMTGSDVDGDSPTYSITSNSANIFGIDSNSGAITVADNTSLNYETLTSHTITVKALDSGGLFATADATITVNNLEENITPTLDATFASAGTGGANSFSAEHVDYPKDSVIDASGKLVVVGYAANPNTSNSDLFIARYNTDGTLDRSFGNKGVINKDLNYDEEAVAVAIDASNNIVVAGIQYNCSGSEVFIIRYTSTGTLDTSFNTVGYRITTYGIPTVAADMLIHPSGSIIVAGSVASGYMRLIKFSADGSSHLEVDVSFFGSSDTATSMVLQSDGKVLISGPVYAGGASFGVMPAASFDFGVARIDVSSTPTLDTTYNGNG